MKKEEKTSKIKKKKEEKYKLVDAERLKKVELIISLIVGVIFLVLLVLSIINVVFLPATLILFALFLFCITWGRNFSPRHSYFAFATITLKMNQRKKWYIYYLD